MQNYEYKTKDLDVATFLHFRGFTDWTLEKDKRIVTFVFYGDVENMFEPIVKSFFNSEYYKLLQAHKQLKKTVWNAQNYGFKDNSDDIGDSDTRDDDDYDNAKQDGII